SLATDALRLGQKLSGYPHHQRALAGAVEHLGIEVDVCVHGDVVHVLQTANDLHVLRASDNGVRRLAERLETAPTETVDGSGSRLDGDTGHQGDCPCDIQSLLALLLCIAQ